MEFEWDPNKAERNLARRGVSFPEAATIFDDPLSVAVPDPDHSFEEQRYIIVGSSHRDIVTGCWSWLIRNAASAFTSLRRVS